MDDIELALVQLFAQPVYGIGEDTQVRYRAVSVDPGGAAERDQVIGPLPQICGGSVQRLTKAVGGIPRREDTNVVTSRQKLLSKGLNVPVDSPLVCP